MVLALLENALHEIAKSTTNLTFSQLIRECRHALGLKQYRAAEFIGVGTMRLKNLETGYFREMPTIEEVTNLAALYDLEMEDIYKRAREQVAQRSLAKKIKRMIGNQDDVQPMPA